MRKLTTEERFTANYLDGDKIQDGQMLSSRECLEAITAERTALLTELRGWADTVEKVYDEHSSSAIPTAYLTRHINNLINPSV